MQSPPRAAQAALSPDPARLPSTGGLLRGALAKRIHQNPAYSLRALARDLDVSHTYLSLVMNGKKTLSMRKVLEFSQRLGLTGVESEAFVRAGSREAKGRLYARARISDAQPGRNERAEEAAAERDEYIAMEGDKLSLLNEWYHFPIADLTLVKSFEEDPEWIARRLRISPAQVRSGIDRLLRLGILERRDGKLVKASTKVSFLPKDHQTAVLAFHRQMARKGVDYLEDGSPEARERRDYSAVTIPIDPSRLPEARKRLMKFRRSLWKFLSSGESTELYQLNLQLFPLSHAVARRGEVIKKAVKKPRGPRQ